MVARFALTFLLLFLLFSASFAQAEAGVSVVEMKFCTGLENRQPVGASSQFFNAVDKIYCYTRIQGAVETTTVRHVWYFDEKEKADVELPVRSSSWRTWSSKRMLLEWAGVWRVEVVTADGTVLLSKEFVYKPMTER